MKSEIESWKQMILTLPDDSFFDLMQIWLGKIESPFNKHNLITRLTNLVSAPKTIERILCLLSSQDKALLSAIEFAPNPTCEFVYSLFKEKVAYPTFTLQLINLEQRLLIYRNRIKSDNTVRETLHLNPILYKALKESAINVNYIVGLKSSSANVSLPMWLNPIFLLSFYSYIEHNHPQIKVDGNFRKKDTSQLKEIFPVLNHTVAHIDKLRLVKELLVVLNLAYIKNEKLYNYQENWLDFFSGEPNLLLQKITIAALALNEEVFNLEDESNSHKSHITKAAIDASAHNINRLFLLYTKNGQYSKENFERLLDLSNLSSKKNIAFEIGLFSKVDKDSYTVCSDYLPYNSENITAPSVLIESNYSCLVKAFTNSSHLLTLASLARPTFCDIYGQFEITKYSFANLLNRNPNLEDIIEDLNAVTSNKVPQNVLHSLFDWQKAYNKVKLLQGTLIIFQEEKIATLLAGSYLEPYILQVVSPSVFLLDEDKIEEWQEVLTRFGVDPLPQIVAMQNKIEVPKPTTFSEGLLIKEEPIPSKKVNTKQSKVTHPQEREITSAINSLALPSEVNQEYLARLEKKLILFPESVQRPSTTFEKREARGLDHQGKISVIRHALTTKKELLEINLISPINGESQILLMPSSLSKAKSDQVLQGITLQSQEELTIDLNQIKSVRRLLSALFF